MNSSAWIALCGIAFLIVVFATFFFWNRIIVRTDSNSDLWRTSLIGSVLACAVFAICFAIGVWFSIARLKGDGWILSA